MVMVIGSEEYNEMLALEAHVLATEAYEKASDADESGFDQEVIELSHDVIDGHEWFVKRRYGDMVELGEEDGLADAVRAAAYYAFEADVINHAKEIGPEGADD